MESDPAPARSPLVSSVQFECLFCSKKKKVSSALSHLLRVITSLLLTSFRKIGHIFRNSDGHSLISKLQHSELVPRRPHGDPLFLRPLQFECLPHSCSLKGP